MRTIAKFALLAAPLSAGAASAEGAVAVASLAVKERLQAIDVINVTAQKAPDAAATAEVDAGVAAILDAAEALEAAEAPDS